MRIDLRLPTQKSMEEKLKNFEEEGGEEGFRGPFLGKKKNKVSFTSTTQQPPQATLQSFRRMHSTEAGERMHSCEGERSE